MMFCSIFKFWNFKMDLKFLETIPKFYMHTTFVLQIQMRWSQLIWKALLNFYPNNFALPADLLSFQNGMYFGKPSIKVWWIIMVISQWFMKWNHLGCLPYVQGYQILFVQNHLTHFWFMVLITRFDAFLPIFIKRIIIAWVVFLISILFSWHDSMYYVLICCVWWH